MIGITNVRGQTTYIALQHIVLVRTMGSNMAEIVLSNGVTIEIERERVDRVVSAVEGTTL